MDMGDYVVRYRGGCGNTYIREEALADLLGEVVRRIQIPADLANQIATDLRENETEIDNARRQATLCIEQLSSDRNF